MKKIDLPQTVAILANIGVLAGIVFLGIEIRQNTRSLEINAYQNLIEQIAWTGTLNVEQPEEMAELSGLLQVSRDELSEEEMGRASSFVMTRLRHGDLAYLQFERGIISEERLESAIAINNALYCTPYFQEFWPTARSVLVQSYGDFLEAKVQAC